MEVKSVSFGEAIKLYFNNYANFKGRSRRSEYWWAILFVNIVTLAISNLLPELAGIWSLVTLVPGVAIVVRRLHDTGRSGWYYFVLLIPLAGPILMIVWLCSDSTEDNQWGVNPKRPSYAAPELPGYPGYTPEPEFCDDTIPAPDPYSPPAPVAAPTISLQLCTGAMAGNTYGCTPGSYVTLGRAPSRCEVVLDASYGMVSGVHCRIQFYDRYATVTDMNSTNGTYVNGSRLNPGQPVTVQNGATIYLANSACAFQIYFN